VADASGETATLEQQPAPLSLEVGAGPAQPYDVIIVGGGPAGATAALYAARGKLRTVVIDKAVSAGALGVTSKIANFPGVPGEMAGADLVRTMREQAASFGAEFVQASATGADLSGEVKRVFTSAGVFSGRAVIIATGSMGRKNKVPGEQEFLGRGVSYCATCDGAFFQGRVVAVVGDSEEAAEEALALAKFASRIHVFVTSERSALDSPEWQEVRTNPIMTMHIGKRLREVNGAAIVEGVVVGDRQGNRETIPVSGVFIYLPGSGPSTEFLAGQVAMKEDGALIVDEYMQTSVAGVFGAGDVRGKAVKQAVVAASDGCIAAMAAEKFIRKRARITPQY
jgi:thioredoxin reductase (NADPH)